jgi:hypothetical protein
MLVVRIQRHGWGFIGKLALGCRHRLGLGELQGKLPAHGVQKWHYHTLDLCF